MTDPENISVEVLRALPLDLVRRKVAWLGWREVAVALKLPRIEIEQMTAALRV